MSPIAIRSLSLVTVIALTSTAQAQVIEEKAQTVTITKRAYAKGDVISVLRTFRMDMKMTVTVPPQSNHPPQPPQVSIQKGSSDDDRLIQVLEVVNGKITKADITFVKKVQTRDLGPKLGGLKDLPDSLDKRSFTIADLGEGQLKIESKKGRINEGDMQKLKNLAKRIFKNQANSLANAIPAQTMKVGDEFRVSSDVLKDLLNLTTQDFKFTERKLVLTGAKKVNGEHYALFAVKYAAVSEGGSEGKGALPMKISGGGKLVVHVATGRQRSLTLQGKPRMNSRPGSPLDMKGSGEIKFRETVKIESVDEAKAGKEKEK